jgi:hypothetical protein
MQALTWIKVFGILSSVVESPFGYGCGLSMGLGVGFWIWGHQAKVGKVGSNRRKGTDAVEWLVSFCLGIL